MENENQTASGKLTKTSSVPICFFEQKLTERRTASGKFAIDLAGHIHLIHIRSIHQHIYVTTAIQQWESTEYYLEFFHR